MVLLIFLMAPKSTICIDRLQTREGVDVRGMLKQAKKLLLFSKIQLAAMGQNEAFAGYNLQASTARDANEQTPASLHLVRVSPTRHHSFGDEKLQRYQ